MRLDICIATHNPDWRTFEVALQALADQSFFLEQDAPELCHVWIIDNASDAPLVRSHFSILEKSQIPFTLLSEPRLGVVHARIRALRSTSAPLVLFVDDDNELGSDYVSQALRLAAEYPEVGCFGGKMLLPKSAKVPRWCEPYMLGGLGIKDCGDERRSGPFSVTSTYEDWMPAATAGLLLRRQVADKFLEKRADDPRVHAFGRSGSRGLLSHEDFLLVTCSAECNLLVAYEPSLQLVHHIRSNRLTLSYLCRLWYAYGVSGVKLGAYCGQRTEQVRAAEFVEVFSYLKGVLSWRSFPTVPGGMIRASHRLGQLVERIRIAKAKSPPGKQVRIGLVGEESVTPTHGTGCVLLKHFEAYDSSLLTDYYYKTRAATVLPASFAPMKNYKMPSSWLALTCQTVSSKLGLTRLYRRWKGPTGFLRFGSLNPSRPKPDVLYSTVFTNASLAFLLEVERRVGGRTPVIQHFMDFYPEDESLFWEMWSKIDPHVVSVWALTPRLKEKLEPLVGREVKVVSVLKRPIPSLAKTSYRSLDQDFRAVMIGNIWKPEAFWRLVELWRLCQSRLRGLPPIAWYGHPRRLEEIQVKPEVVQDAVRDAGLLPPAELEATLRDSDMAMLAFDHEESPSSPYGDYSFPSKMGDYCAAGLPIFALAGPSTATACFIRDEKLGAAASGHDLEVAVAELIRWIQDEELREQAGLRARKYAEENFDLKSHQSFLYNELTLAARTGR